MAQSPAYCGEQCSICPLRELSVDDEVTHEYVARSIANVFSFFRRAKIIEADRQARFVHDGSSIRVLRWQAQLLKGEDTMPLDLDDERRVDTAILNIATGECENYFAERR